MWPAAPIPGQWAYVLGACVLLALAAAAWVRGWRYDRAKGRPRCHKCGYPVVPGNARDVTEAVERAAQSNSKAKGWSCPECGWVPRRVKDLTRTRRSRRWLAASLLLVLGAVLCWYTIHVQYRRLTLGEPLTTAATPTTWWIAVLPYRSGNEDLIVYYRAYPWGQMQGANSASLQLPGSGRQFNVPARPRGSWLPFFSMSGQQVLPAWQQRLAVDRLASRMQQPSRSVSQRADAAWLYAVFSNLDHPKTRETLLALLDAGEEDMTWVLFSVLYEREDHSEIAASAYARIVEEDTYSDYLRFAAAEELGCCGERTMPIIRRWIDEFGVEIDPFLYTTIHHATLWAQTIGEPTPGYLLLILKSLLASPTDWHFDTALLLMQDSYGRYWDSGDSIHEFFMVLRPEFEAHLRASEADPSDLLHLYASSYPEELQRRLGPRDPRVLEAWAWLLAQPIEVLQQTAAEGLGRLSGFLTGTFKRDREPRARARAVIEAAMETGVSDSVRDTLHFAIDSLDYWDRRTAEREAERAAAHSEREAEHEQDSGVDSP